MMPYMEIGYLIGSVSFVLGLKMMGQPDSARKGNLVAAFGMAVAVIAALFFTSKGFHVISNLQYIVAAIVAGTVIGTLMAKRVQMTAMPEMVSLFNGMGGLSAALISIIEWRHLLHTSASPEAMDQAAALPIGMYIPIMAGLIIGTISFIGSIVAWGKLNGKIGDFRFPSQQIINAVVLIAILGVAYLNYGEFNATHSSLYFFVTIGLAIVYGLLFVFPIGGADMPVVISLLNSFTGVAAA
jgi:NAD(P) transhydrogenase subunit beta